MLKFGQYEVVEEIGRGGMGVVYKGFDPLIRRDVALKTIRLSDIADPSERKQMQDRLEREAQSAGRLSHPNIVTIYQIGYAELQPGQTTAFIAMEFVPGRTLASIIEKIRPTNTEQVVKILRQTAIALDYAHSEGVIHRDIKPANLLITPDARLKITDFGVAKITSQTMTLTGTILGSPFYMSPEQIKAEPVDGRTDQYSLAVVSYEIFGGKKPFQAETLSSLVYKIAHEEPPRLDLDSVDFGDRLNDVLLRAMAKRAGDRYPTCTAFVDALAAAVEDRSVPSPPRPSGPEPPAADVSAPPAGQSSPQASAAPPPSPTPAPPATANVPAPQPPVPATPASADATAIPPAPVAIPVSSGTYTLPVAKPRRVHPAVLSAAAVGLLFVAAYYAFRPGGAAPAAPAQSAAIEPRQPDPESPPSPTQETGRPERAVPTPPPAARSQRDAAADTRPSQPPRTPTAKTASAESAAKPPAPAPQTAAKSAVNAPAQPPAQAASQPSAQAAAQPSAQAVTQPPQAPVEPPRPATQPPAAQPARAEPVRTPPVLARQVPAAYTDDARRKGIEGVVALSLDINEQGVPVRARLLRSLDPGLDRKAVDAVAQWRFTPATEDGRPVASTANVEVSFKLFDAPPKRPLSLKKSGEK